MTYKEQWEKDHPDMSWDEEHVCPKDQNGNIVKCPAKTTSSCIDCWNREIPEEPKEDNMATATNSTKEAAVRMGARLKAATVGTPIIKDSGNRTEFATGAVRDMREGKGRCDLMPLRVVAEWLKDDILGCIAQFKTHGTTTFLYGALNYFLDENGWSYAEALLEVAKHFEEGAKKYGENNWQKGIPVKCYIDSAVRHYLKWLRGDKDEPHDRAFVWNLMCCIWEVDYRPKEENE